LRLWLLYDMFQCQNIRTKNVLNAHIRSVTFLCKHTESYCNISNPFSSWSLISKYRVVN
jgi:hypothetical protein